MPKHSFDACTDLLYGYYLDGSAEAKQALTNVIDDLLYYFGNESSIRLYRGLSFDTAKLRLAFISALGKDLILNEQYISSWSTSFKIAQGFAKAKRYGIVISLAVRRQTSVDLRVLRFSNELEHILPPGSYKLDKYTLIT